MDAPMTIRPTMAAMYRWSIAIAGAPVDGKSTRGTRLAWEVSTPRGGSNTAPHSGQPGQAAVASAPRTYAPLTRSTNVPTAAATASHVQPPLGTRTVDGQRTTTASTVSVARSSSAFARWTVTHSGG